KVDRPKAGRTEPCLFCRQGAVRPSAKSLVLAVSPLVVVMMNLYPYNIGHVLVAPRKHRAFLADLSEAEIADLGLWLARVERALRKEYRPHGLNLGMNLGRVAGAGVLGHLHWHVVPRWGGDTNFMPVTADTKVMPEALDRTYARVRRALDAEAARGATRRR
ncbi:MAG TPA: HIT domain-containing protein, partial [Candidatus Eisenbacteria bacterium]